MNSPSLFSNRKKKTFNNLRSHMLRRRALLFSYICVTVLRASWLIVFFSTGQADKVAEWWHHHHSVSDWKVTVFSLMISAHAPISDLPLDHNIIQAHPTPSPSNKGPSITFLTSKRVELHFKFRLLALVENVFVACESFYLSSPSPSAPSVLYPS